MSICYTNEDHHRQSQAKCKKASRTNYTPRTSCKETNKQKQGLQEMASRHQITKRIHSTIRTPSPQNQFDQRINGLMLSWPRAKLRKAAVSSEPWRSFCPPLEVDDPICQDMPGYWFSGDDGHLDGHLCRLIGPQ